MLLLHVRATPLPGCRHEGQCAGAIVLCYVDFKDRWEAEQVARANLRADGWEPVDLLEIVEVTEANCAPDRMDEYRTALETGVCFVYLMYKEG